MLLRIKQCQSLVEPARNRPYWRKAAEIDPPSLEDCTQLPHLLLELVRVSCFGHRSLSASCVSVARGCVLHQRLRKPASNISIYQYFHFPIIELSGGKIECACAQVQAAVTVDRYSRSMSFQTPDAQNLPYSQLRSAFTLAKHCQVRKAQSERWCATSQKAPKNRPKESQLWHPRRAPVRKQQAHRAAHLLWN